MNNQKKWSQFFTPVWAAELLFAAHFSNLTDKDTVWEPSCGKGSWLNAIPEQIPAIGSDIDPLMVQASQKNTSRKIYNGDFRDIMFEEMNRITAICGNPPFILKIFEEFMQRCENILPLGNKAGFIIPAYFVQTSQTTKRLGTRWDISQEILPRDLFQGEGLLSKPIIFASFIRNNSPQLFGFRLFHELVDVKNLREEVREILNKGNGSVWRQALIKVMRDSGGKATLDQIYKNMQGKRPTENPFWKEQVRKLIRQSPFQKVDDSTYQLIN